MDSAKVRGMKKEKRKKSLRWIKRIKGIKNFVSWKTRMLDKKCQGMEKKDIKTGK